MATVTNQNNYTGTPDDDNITGTAGNDTLAGGAGNDTIDGAGGYNIVQYAGTEYDYIVKRLDDGAVEVRALAGTDYSSDGTDTLRNIQEVQFIAGASSRVLDDVSNVQASTNVVIGFGEEVTGQIFRGDKDWYQIQGGVANQAVHIVLAGGEFSGLSIGDGGNDRGNYLWGQFWPDREIATSLDGAGALGLQVVASNSSGSYYFENDWYYVGEIPLNRIDPYRLTVFRDLVGTDASETLSAGSTAEYLDGQAGDDLLQGSDRSDYLLGGAGSDTLIGGAGNDILRGGDGPNDRDVAIFEGRFSDYTLENSNEYSDSPAVSDWWKLTHKTSGEVDYIRGVEVLRFNDLDYVVDDYDVFQGTDIQTQVEFAEMGDLIEGRFTKTSEDDWIAFDFGRNVVDQGTTLKVSVNFADEFVHSKNISFVNVEGYRLYFNDLSDNTTKSGINLEHVSGQRDFLINGIQWGENQEGGLFGGNKAFLVVEAMWGNRPDYTNPNQGAYTISINRYRQGSTADDVLTTDGDTEQLRVEELAGLAGNDLLQGTDRVEVFDGGEGNDTIEGGGGNDRLRGGTGQDELYGQAGDDTFIVSGETTVNDLFDGGSGTDRLQVNNGVNLTGATFVSVELLEGTGQRVAIDAQQMLGFTAANGVIFSGSNQDRQTLSGTYSLEGTTGNDTLIAGDGDNVIRPMAGVNTVSAGAGNDLVIWQTGFGGDNWDNQYYADRVFSSKIDGTNYVIEGSYDGGIGNDTLEFRVDDYIDNVLRVWSFQETNPSLKYGIDLTRAEVTSFETIKLTSGQFERDGIRYPAGPTSLHLTADQFAQATTLSGGQFVVRGGGVVDLGAVTLTNGAKVSLSGDQAFDLRGTAAGEALSTFGGNDVVTAGAGNDTISSGAGIDNIDAGAGDDLIIVSDKSAVLDTIDGGTGTDTLRITGGDVDLSGATLTGIESIVAASASLALTEAQYAAYASSLTGNAGLILKMTESGTASVADLPDGFVGIRGFTGNDVLSGSDADDLLVGDAGNDYITGGLGNDRLVGSDGNDALFGQDGDDYLVTGAGLDTLSGGSGNDTLVVSDKLAVQDQLIGGTGTDTLIVSDGQNLTLATISGIEILKGSGTVTLNAAQLAGFTSVQGVTVQLAGESLKFALENITLSSGAVVRLPDADPQVTVSSSAVAGSKGDDEIVGGTGNDLLLGGRGSDYISGGLGNDTLVGGSATDTLVGGAGDDQFLLQATEFENASQGQVFVTTPTGERIYVDWTERLVYADRMDGGEGDDRLVVDLGGGHRPAYVVNSGLVSGIEEFEVKATSYEGLVALDAGTFKQFSSVMAGGMSSDFAYGFVRLAIVGDAEDIALDSIAPDAQFGQILFSGTFHDIDASSLTIPQARGSSRIVVSDFDSITLSSGSDGLRVERDTEFSVVAGAGDDVVALASVSGVLNATIDGGEGNDELDLSGGYSYESSALDISGSTITGFETIRHGSTTLIVTDDQKENLSFEGAGAIYTRVGNAIVGTDQADNYSGSGTESFQGGRGNDTISYVNTAVFTGNKSSYVWERTNGNTLTIEQVGGSLLDGRDTLQGVMNLQFADGVTRIDDAPDQDVYSRYFDRSAWSTLQVADYGKAVSGKKDYGSDTDLFRATLVPNSPIVIEGSNPGGDDWAISAYDIETGANIQFKSLVRGDINWEWNSWMDSEGKWLPVMSQGNDVYTPYVGGDIVLSMRVQGDIQDYAFTLSYLDDYADSVNTLGQMDAKTGVIRGYVGDIADVDWIRTDLIAGTKYEFELTGLSSGGGTLADPLLRLYDSKGRLIEAGADLVADSVGTDDTLVFRANESGSYYLAVSDVGETAKGSWTLTQKSFDIAADNVTTTERIDWSGANTFTVNGEVNDLTDRDWFKIWLDSGMTYSFRALGASNGGTLADPDIAIRSVTGILLAQDDNSGGSTDAKLAFSAPDSGWYFLDAGASGNSGKGTYILKGSTLADDYSNDVFTTGSVQTGESLQGLVSYIGDSDWVQVGLSRGVTYVIDLVGDTTDGAELDPLVDPLLIIRDSSGNQLARSDDFGGTLNARAYFTPDANGVYYLEARSAFKYDIGAWKLSVSPAPPDDHVSVIDPSATELELRVAQNGEIGMPGDRDVFKVDLQSGRVYELAVKGLAGKSGSLADPFVRVFDAQGRLVDFDNNGGAGNDAGMFFVPEVSGTYFIEASSNHDRGMGTYKVTVTDRDMPADEAPSNVSTDVVLSPGEMFYGNLLTHNDQDWFKIQLTGREDYVFRLQGARSGNGTLADPVLDLYAGNGARLQTVDNMLMSNEPAMLFTPVDSGTYYLAVRAADGQADTGTYRLVTRAPDDYSNTKPGAELIELGQTLDGGIQWSDGAFGVRAYDAIGLATDMDEDWFKFNANAGDVLSVQVEFADGSTLSRPMVEVVDELGRSLAIGDGLETANGAANATIKAAANGTYYARVIDGAGATGAYRISLSAGDSSDEDSAGPVAMSFANAGSIVQAQSVARIGLAGDSDAFTVQLQEGHSYRIETMAVRDGSQAPLPSATLGLNWLAQGAQTGVEIDVSGQTARPSFFDNLVFEADTAGTMSISVAPLEATQTGQYKLRVVDLGVEQQDDRPDLVADYIDGDHGVLAGNENSTGRIDSATDADLFGINLTVGNVYDFSVKSFLDGLGTLSEAQLRLLDSAGQLVTVGEHDQVTGRTDMAVSVFDGGRYYLEVTGADLPGNVGTYSLDTRLRGSVQFTDDISASTRSGVIAAPGQPATGVINAPGDHDWIKTTLEAGKVYVLDVLADGDGAGGTLKDATMRLLDANGTELMADDNSGAALDPRLQFTAGAAGDYFIDVGSNGEETGSYTVRVRELYSGVADPLKSSQWYLDAVGLDKLGGQFSGAGITVGVVDDGIDTAHPDLQKQLDFAAAYDTVGNTRDGSHKSIFDYHGTLVAGIIAAEQNNETGIVGVAPDAELASTRVKWSWGQITEALGRQWQFDVSNNSWSAIDPFGDNFNSTELTFAWQALRTGVEDGRDGLGTVFVFSAGNSAGSGDNTNYHNFQNAREVIAVGAAEADGSMAGFSTPGANVLVSTYGSGMISTDRHETGLGLNPSGNYASFGGTSAAAPMVSGIVSLMLEANPELGYRDVQEILVYSTTHPESQDWKTNAATNYNLGGLRYNDKAGFGLVDAYTAVRLAQTWTQTSTAINEVSDSARQFGMVDLIPDGNGSAYTKTFTIDGDINVEHVELGVDLRHTRLGDLVIELVSPNGTVSTLMNRPTVNAEQPFGLSGADSSVPTHLLWDFSSVQFWGEQAAGDWTVSIKDVRAEQTGMVHSLSLRVYGERDTGDDTYVFTDEGFMGVPLRVLADEYGTDTINASPVSFDTYIDLSQGVIAARGVSYEIADWSVIENAITGSGDDRLDGNDVANTLNGMEGNDTLTGGRGDDILIGGTGSDTAVYAGALGGYTVSWNPTDRTITVEDVNAADGDDGTDTLLDIERLVFSDAEMSLSDKVGNAAPVANKTFFDSPVFMNAGAGIDFVIPDDAFTDDQSSTAQALTVEITDASGAELPDWLSYDPTTKKISGVPPEDYQGQLALLVTAIDEYGETTADILTLQFGDNQAPVVDAASQTVLQEDAGLVNLGISVPVDPEGTAVTVTITDIPAFGLLLDKQGEQLVVGATLTADELTELHYQTAQDQNGDAGYVRYEVVDEDGVVAQSSVRIFVEAVNDAPRFATESNTVMMNYPDESTISLDMLTPTDPESVITTVRVVGLPEMGLVTLDDAPLALDTVLTFDQLERLVFTLSENVNGPIGAVTIQAVDPEGLATNWSLAIEVQGDEAYSVGSAGADQLYGSIGNDTLYGMAGDDVLVGNAGNDRLLGSLGNDQLFGGSGNDTLDGSSGNDMLDGGSGNDVMAGGPGDDTYFVDSASDVVLEVISGGAGGTDLIVTEVSLTAPTNIENLQAAAGFVIDLTGNELDNALLGNDEDNRLSGGAGRDRLFGGAGNDVLDGGSGVDRMAGGAGDDIYYVDSRSDVIVELADEGIDHVFAKSSYTLSSNVEKLTLQEGGDYSAGGNSLDNHLIGNSSNNVLAGGLGADTLEGGLGNDTYVLSDSLDTIIDTGGIDTIRSVLDVHLPADIENIDLVGFANTMGVGNGANNVISGNLGNNILEGRGGVDQLEGGAGDDQFIIAYNGAGLDPDSILDFESGSDLIVVDLASFGVDVFDLGLASSGTASADSFVKVAGVKPLDVNDHYLFDTATGVLSFDPDGNGDLAAMAMVHFAGGGTTELTALDLYIAV